MRIILFLILSGLLLGGCSSNDEESKPRDFSNIHIGMARTQVLEEFGKPDFIESHPSGVVVYRYGYNIVKKDLTDATDWYYVSFFQNKVASFGDGKEFKPIQ